MASWIGERCGSSACCMLDGFLHLEASCMMDRMEVHTCWMCAPVVSKPGAEMALQALMKGRSEFWMCWSYASMAAGILSVKFEMRT